MKIRKAIEKAKQAREQMQGQGRSTEREYMEMAARQGEWTPPVYSESRYVELDRDRMARNKCIALFPDSPYLDAFKILRTRINHLTLAGRSRTLMVTSVVPGEGKTLTAINLALTYAKEFSQTVLLVDCDFRRQDVHRYMGIESDRGLVDYLLREIPLKDIIIWPGLEKMTLISGGQTIQESTELLESSRMHGLVEELKNRYPDRFVIFDVPPVLAGADAIVFSTMVESIVMVVEAHKTPVEEIKNALDLLPRDKFLGFVLNKHDATDQKYRYYYRYQS
jgi:non-specific protein-tyrosine kinase